MMILLIRRELRHALAGPVWLPIAFFLLIAILVPFAVGPDVNLLERIGPGILWISALTAALLPIERLIEPDRASGVIDQLKLHGVAEETVAASKILAHWLSFGPMLLVSAIIASALLGIDARTSGWTVSALAVGTPGLAALAISVATLTAGLPRSSAVAAILLLPLALPLLIFGSAASGDGNARALLLEGAASLFIAAGAPFVAGAAIRAART